MTTTADNLRLLAERIGIERVAESLELHLGGSASDLESAQTYMLGAIHGYLENNSPSQEELREWYELLGLSLEETRDRASRQGN